MPKKSTTERRNKDYEFITKGWTAILAVLVVSGSLVVWKTVEFFFGAG